MALGSLPIPSVPSMRTQNGRETLTRRVLSRSLPGFRDRYKLGGKFLCPISRTQKSSVDFCGSSSVDFDYGFFKLHVLRFVVIQLRSRCRRTPRLTSAFRTASTPERSKATNEMAMARSCSRSVANTSASGGNFRSHPPENRTRCCSQGSVRRDCRAAMLTPMELISYCAEALSAQRLQ
jgi:hypothetical protein